MAVCKTCGAEIKDGEKHCSFCGASNSFMDSMKNITDNEFDDFINQLKNTPDTTDTTNEFAARDIENNKGLAILAYFGWLVFIPICFAKESKFARFHANQGLILFISGIILGIVAGIATTIPFVGDIISGIMSLCIIIEAVIGIINAGNGKAKELPFIGKYKILN